MALGLATTYLKKFDRSPETPIQKMMEGGDNELFEAAFEVGVRSGMDGSTASHSAAASDSAKATYAGSGGQGVVTDFDRLYAANGVNPAHWGGVAATPSLYQMELHARGVGAYSAESGWVSGYTARQRQLKDARIAELVQVCAGPSHRRQLALQHTSPLPSHPVRHLGGIICAKLVQ